MAEINTKPDIFYEKEYHLCRYVPGILTAINLSEPLGEECCGYDAGNCFNDGKECDARIYVIIPKAAVARKDAAMTAADGLLTCVAAGKTDRLFYGFDSEYQKVKTQIREALKGEPE